MSEQNLTRESIIEATELVLRRFGPAKANVTDVARALNVSHGAVYRHFPSKADLIEAVARKWLSEMMPPLDAIVEEKAPAPQRLRQWILLLFHTKRQYAAGDPELCATFFELTSQSRDVAFEHVERLASSIAKILSDGMSDASFTSLDPIRTAKSILFATTKYHHPSHTGEWKDPDIDKELDDLLDLILRGISV